MTHLTASARLKVNRDTWFLPDPNGGAYFRNNSGSFRIKGSSIAQWFEKLLPMFNGEHSLEDLTKGLQAPYRKRVYEIGETLYKTDSFATSAAITRTNWKAQCLKRMKPKSNLLKALPIPALTAFSCRAKPKYWLQGLAPFSRNWSGR